jgi:hypothetical protein
MTLPIATARTERGRAMAVHFGRESAESRVVALEVIRGPAADGCGLAVECAIADIAAMALMQSASVLHVWS